MIKIKIKPISVNEVWQGRRSKTNIYKVYEKELSYLLPANKYKIKKDTRIELNIIYGFSSKLADLDNPTKPFIDVLQKKYGFNDNQIYNLILEKEIVKKGDEFIEFNMNLYD